MRLVNELRLEWLLKCCRVFMFGRGSRDDVVKGQWQMGRYRGAENFVYVTGNLFGQLAYTIV